MTEVDYSQFYYTRGRPLPSPEKKPKRKHRVVLVLFVLVIIFALVFFGADFFTGGRLINAVGASLRGNTYEYYLVVTEAGVRDMAYARSLLIKQGGGSGYIIEEDGKFLIVLTVFCDRTQADAVVAKNPNSYVHTVGFKTKSAEIYNSLDVSLKAICDGAKRTEEGSMSESEFLGVLNTAKRSAEELKSKFAETATAGELNLLEYLIGGVGSLEIGKGTRMEFLSDVRYLLSGIVVSMGMNM